LTTTSASTNHIGKALQVMALIGAVAGGCAFFVRVGMWIAQVQAPPVAVAVPPAIAAQFDACRALIRALDSQPPQKEHP
jgi:hypothetical protein